MTDQRESGEYGEYLDKSLRTFYRTVERQRIASAAAGQREDQSPRAEPVPPPTIGRLEIGRVLGRGGLGVVLRARDTALERDVAVKLLQESFGGDSELAQRFMDEAKISSQLQHPGVVPVYDIGHTDDGRPFYTMKIVDGETLKQWLATRAEPSPAQDVHALEIFTAVCQTLAFAHARGVVHGDLKPGNVMVGAFGEVRVLDWGFGKVQAAARTTAQTGTGAPRVLGTPAYMAPEQARGDVDAIDARTDVFGLGGILCEILTGAPVYLGETKTEVLRQASDGQLDDTLRRLHACRAEAALIEIARQCLAAEKVDRLPDAGAVSRRLTDYLAAAAERSRELELEASNALAVAPHEARARRLTVAVKVAIVLALLTIGAAYGWLERQQRDRAAQTERLLVAAAERAQALFDQARRAPIDDHVIWEQALAAAHQGEQLARESDVDHGLRAESRALVAEIETARRATLRDEVMRARLEETRSHRDGGAADVEAEYAAVFASYGLPIDELDVDGAAKTVRGSRIPQELILGLDEWALWRGRRDQPSKQFAVAQLADENPWRRNLRDLIRAKDRDGIRALARRAELDGAPVAGLLLLAMILASSGDGELAAHVFRGARVRWPDAFLIHHDLASLLQRLAGRRPTAEVIGLSWSCVVLRPDSAHAWTDLGMRLLQIGEVHQGDAALERAIELDPGYARAWALRGAQECVRGNVNAGIESLRRAAALAEDDPEIQKNVALALEFDAFRPREALANHATAAALPTAGRNPACALGDCLTRLGRYDAAVAELRAGLGRYPSDVDLLGLLGRALSMRGSFDDALTVYRRGAESDKAGSMWRWTELVADVERLRAAAAPARALRPGEVPNQDPEQLLDLARAALYQALPLTASELFRAAFAASADLAGRISGGRSAAFEAACAAARVGQSDDDGMAPSVRSSWSDQARAWLGLSLREMRQAVARDGVDPALRMRLVEHFARDEFEPYRSGDGPDAEPWARYWGDLAAFRDDLRR